MTPLGREICDILLAVNRSYGKSDYILVSTGEGMPDLRVLNRSRIELVGRIQSREYQKRISEFEVVKRTAYEVSVNKLEMKVPEEE